MRALNVPWRRSVLNTGVFVACYVVLRVLSSVAETRYAQGTGFSPWSMMAALDVLLFLVCGWRWWPLPVAAGAARVLLFPAGLHASPLVNLAVMVPSELALALATRVTVEYLHVRFPLRTLRDVWRFVWSLGAATPVVVSAIAVAGYTFFGRFTTADAPAQFAKMACGEITSIVVFLPFFTQVLAWREPLDETMDRPPPQRRPGFWWGLALTLAIVLVQAQVSVRVGRPVVELSFLPMAWLAIRYGLRGAVVGTVVADVGATALYWFFSVPLLAQVEYQGYLIATAVMALLLGAITRERAALVARLQQRAHVDDLTSLPNRERLLAWLGRHRTSPTVLAIVDIDNMRLLNEGVGRDAADRLLYEFGWRLRDGLGSEYFVARVSGDEFAVAAVGERSPHAIIAHVRGLFEEPFDVDGARLFVAASVGAVHVGRLGNPDEVMRRADLALHRAKNTSTGAAIYTPDLQGAGMPLLVVELHRAVEQGELVPFFQPIYHFNGKTHDWELAGAEALVRWLHPQRGVIGPEHFIDLLGRLSIGERMDWSVLERSLAHAKRWREHLPEFRVWVNLFPRQSVDPNCAANVRAALTRAGADPASLVIEICERVVAGDEREAAAVAQDLRALGVSTAIDDFGTGGSSLTRLRDVPVEILKIDRSFVTRSEIDAKAKAVAAAIVRLASDLGMVVVAEGIENAHQAEAMIDLGCRYAQGYALGHPMPAAQFENLVLGGAPQIA